LKRLTRSRTNKVFSGIFGGLGEYFNIDATLFRIAYVFFGFANPFLSLLVYGIASAIIPEGDDVIYHDYDYGNTNDNSKTFIGVGLIILGAVLLMKNLLPPFHIMFPNFRQIIRQVWDFWPVLLILLGVYVLFNQRKDY